MSRRWTSDIGLVGNAGGQDLGTTMCMHVKSVGDGHDGLDGGHYHGLPVHIYSLCMHLKKVRKGMLKIAWWAGKL